VAACPHGWPICLPTKVRMKVLKNCRKY